AISTVGVVESPRSTTSIPMLCNVPITRFRTISPETRASRPTTILSAADCCWIKRPNAAVNLTISIGVSASPGLPPIVPRMPEMDLINVMYTIVFEPVNLDKFHQGNGILELIFIFVATLFNLYDRPTYFVRPGRIPGDQPGVE